VLTGNWSNDLLLLMKASHNAGLKVHFGTTSLDQPGNIGNAGDAAEGSYVAQTYNTAAAEPATLEFSQAYKTATGNFPVYVEPQTIFAMEMLGSALSATTPVNNALLVKNLAENLEKASIQSPLGTITVRKDDHQAVFPMVVSVVSRDAKYKVDGTDLGFKPVRIFTAEEAAVPAQATCKMQRP
ncbi:MAG TPA: ABC transporter substrate-binding protein, partial [Rhizobium sp.]